jgi:DNA-binding LacI/PurR family transcriptional regulator
VLDEARRVGYVANPIAQGLRAGRTNVLALTVRSLDFRGEYRPEGVDHFTRVAGFAAFTALDRGFRLMLVPARNGEADADPRWADGYVIEDPLSKDPFIAKLRDHGVPVVTIGRDPAQKAGTPWVGNDIHAVTTQLLDILHTGGARRVWLIAGQEPNSWNQTTQQTYHSWCGEHGIEPMVLECEEKGGTAAGYAVAGQVMGRADSPDGVLCLTGRHASGFARRCHDMGIRIPQDLLIAAGNDAEQARTSTPGITAADLQAELLGQQAVELLADIVTTGSSEQSRTLSPRILLRESTAPRAG